MMKMRARDRPRPLGGVHTASRLPSAESPVYLEQTKSQMWAAKSSIPPRNNKSSQAIRAERGSKALGESHHYSAAEMTKTSPHPLRSQRAYQICFLGQKRRRNRKNRSRRTTAWGPCRRRKRSRKS